MLLFILLLWLLLSLLGVFPWPAAYTRLLLPDVYVPRLTGLEEVERRQKDLWAEYMVLHRQLEEYALQCRPKKEVAIPPPPKPVQEPVQEPMPAKEPEPATAPPALSMPEPITEPPFIATSEPKTPPATEPPLIAMNEPETPLATEPPALTMPEPAPQKNDTLHIPKDAAKNNDISFLEGCWYNNTDLVDDYGKKLVVEYCFNKNGSGHRTVHELNGAKCTGKASAKFDSSGNLLIDGGVANCRGSSRFTHYFGQKVRCTGSGKSTNCRGKAQGGTYRTWEAEFRRK